MNPVVALVVVVVVIIISLGLLGWYHKALDEATNSLPDSQRIPILVILDPTEYWWKWIILICIGAILVWWGSGN